MPAAQGATRLDQIAMKWRKMADRRLEYYTELYRSGRWRHYYSQEDFAVRMLDVIKAVKVWYDLAERTSSDRHLVENERSPADRARSAA
jgi:uncharacterized repeat protein (TIGR03809 family)